MSSDERNSPDCQGRAGQSEETGTQARFSLPSPHLIQRVQRAFDLEVINIQDKGREKWKKKYVYWIPALHLDGKEIAKGRWDASTVLEALKQREATLDSQQSTE
ncbi:hypothetical protein JVT61DRAFT_2400 [Boletus reticuloceps]|uniref:Glutaredoxin-like protein n=1 Tax=Boletus reticuloceps TaxID=495285 RepID=A0A8I2YP72_9AGAM|nr:hypothetical protein JVT61DRAFT_2400 [Boletus reticuloceps]